MALLVAPSTSAQFIDEDEVPLNVFMVHLARYVHYRGFWPGLCRRRLQGLLDKPLQFVRGSTPVPSTSVSEQFRAIIDKHWKRFGSDVIDEIMAVGIVATRRVRIATGDDVPTVISSEGIGKTHQITVRFDVNKNQNVYRVYRSRATKPGQDTTWKIDHQAVVLSDFGNEPLLNGEIRSIAWAAVNWELYWQNMLRFSHEAEFILMRPTLVEQQPEQGGLADDTARFGRYGEAIGVDVTDQRGQYERSGLPLDKARLQRDVNDPTPGWTPQKSELLLSQTQFFRNVLTLPPGSTLARQQLPVRNTALPEIARMYESAVSALYGVPRSQLVQDMSSATRTASSEMSNEGLRHTVMHLSSKLAKAYTWAYNDIYGEDELERSLQRVTRLSKDARPMTQEEIFTKAIDGARVRVVLSIPPTVTQGELFFLHTQGIIEWEEYHDSLRTLGGFTGRQAPEKPPDLAYFPPEDEQPPAAAAAAAGGKPAPRPKPQRKPRTESLAADYIMQNSKK